MRWRGWRRQGDGGRRIRRVVHGQDQAGAPDCHLLFRQGEVVIQPFVGRAAPGRAFAVDSVGSGGVRADSDVRVHGAHGGVVQDEVRILVVERTFILWRSNRE